MSTTVELDIPETAEEREAQRQARLKEARARAFPVMSDQEIRARALEAVVGMQQALGPPTINPEDAGRAFWDLVIQFEHYIKNGKSDD